MCDGLHVCNAAGFGGVESAYAHLRDHHMAVKGTLALGSRRSVDMRPDLRHDGSAKGHVWDEVAVHLARFALGTCLFRGGWGAS